MVLATLASIVYTISKQGECIKKEFSYLCIPLANLKLFKRYLILISYLILFVFVTNSAEYTRRWSEKDGLSNREIHHLIRDSEGFIWIATANGLNRFDGYKFWSPEKVQGFKLSSNKTTWLLENNNTLWIATSEGVNLMDLNTYKIIDVFKHNNNSNSLIDNYVTGVFKTNNKVIWVITGKGVLHQYDNNKGFKRILNPLVRSGSFGVRLHFAEDDHFIWIKSEGQGTYQLTKSGKLIKYFPAIGKPHIGGIINDKEWGVLSFCEDGVKRFNYKKSEFEPFLLANNQVFEMAKDYNKNLWFITNDTKKLISVSGSKIIDKTNVLFDKSDNVHIRQIIEGKSHSLWVCTNNGLFQLSIERELFTSILRKDQVNQSEYVPSFRGMSQDDDGTIYIGGYGGVFKWTNDKKVVQLVDNKTPYSPYLLMDDYKGYLYAVTEGFGLIKINKRDGSIIKTYSDKSIPDQHRYQYLLAGCLDDDGNFWLGGYEGMFRLNTITRQSYECNLVFDGIELNQLMIRQFYKTKDNRLWISTQKGVFVLNQKRKPIAHYCETGKGIYKIPNNMVACVYEGDNGTIWIGTIGGGICAVNEKAQTTETFDIQNGLADNNVASILEDKQNRIWIGTDFGLSVLDGNTKTINNFYEEDGLSNNEFNVGSALKSKDGMLLMGGINGINIFNPIMDLHVAQGPQYIRFSRLEIIDNNDEIKEIYNPIEIKKGINLTYKNRYVGIDFFITDFLRVEKNTYKYKLEGFDERWIPIGEQRTLRFASLPAGNYTLHIIGKGTRGAKVMGELTIPVTVGQVFYKTWWFALISLFLVSVIVYMTQHEKIQKLKEISALRVKLASDLHDDVGSVLTRIAMQAELIEPEVTADGQKVLSSIMASCRNALSNMRDVIWSIDSRSLSSGNLFDKITELSQHMFEFSTFNYTLSFDQKLYNIPLSQYQKQEVYFIVKEAIHNIIKHAEGDMVAINGYGSLNQLVISIANSGSVNQSKINTGQGIQNMKLRASRIKATIQINTDNGYLLTVTIPIKNRKI